jgi:hypothetical protein
MLKEEKRKTRTSAQTPARAAYNPPHLTDFGSVGTLTQAGTGANAEMGMSMSTMQRA